MGDRRDAAIVADAESVYKGVVGDPVRFAGPARELVLAARREGAAEALVVALRALAWARSLSTRNAEARALLDEAVRVAGRNGLERRLGEVLASRVAVLSELGLFPAAQRDADRAAALLPADELAQVVFQQAVLLQNAGHLAAAAALYRRVLADPGCPQVLLAKAGNNLAHLEGQLGRVGSALALLATAERQAQGAPAVLAYVAVTRAWVLAQAGRLPQSLVQFDLARERYDAAGLSLAAYHVERSDALAALRLLPEALAAAREGVRELPEGEVSLMAAEARLRVAQLALLTGDLPGAGAAAVHSASLLRRQRRPGWLARAEVVGLEVDSRQRGLTRAELTRLRRQAQVLQDSGLVGEAVAAWLLAGRLGGGHDGPPALDTAARLGRTAPVLVRLQARVAAALLAERRRQPAAVLRACRAGLSDLDAHRAALPTVELRALASAHGAELGEVGLRALVPTGAAARVFGWLERTRAAAVAPLHGDTDERVLAPLGVLRAVQAELAELRSAGDPEPPGLLDRVTQAEEQVRRASWAGAGTGGSRAAPTAAEVRARLTGGALVEYGVLRDRAGGAQVVAVVLTPRRSRLVPLGPLAQVGAQADAVQFALRRLARGGSPLATQAAARSTRAALDALRGALLVPLRVDPQGPLVVVPVGELQRLPWAALHAGPTAVVPSAGLWLAGLDAPAPEAGVALVAGPDLAHAEQEVAALRQLHPAATVLAGPAATCAATLDLLRSSRTAHLACHGRVRTDNPAFSSLLLADGPLSVHELSLSGRAPHRVVLAACEAGAQVGYPGDEALGFVTALLARGSAGVLASGVLVPDEATVPLLHAVHEGLAAGRSLSASLHAARTRVQPQDDAQLAAWCAFDAYGAA